MANASGFFDPTAIAPGWFDDTAASVGWFDSTLLKPSGASSPSLTAVTGTGVLGSVKASITVDLTGVASTTAIGNLTVSGGGTAALSNITAVAALGLVLPTTSAPLTSLVGTGVVGSVKPTLTTALSSVGATSGLGLAGPTVTVQLLGASAAGAVGSVGVGITKNLLAVSTTGATGIVTRFSGSVYPLPSQVLFGITYGPNGNDYTGTLVSSSSNGNLIRGGLNNWT